MQAYLIRRWQIVEPNTVIRSERRTTVGSCRFRRLLGPATALRQLFAFCPPFSRLVTSIYIEPALKQDAFFPPVTHPHTHTHTQPTQPTPSS